jgi:hypothetical protein
VSERERNPTPHPVACRLRRQASNDTEDVVALVGFLGAWETGAPFRLYSDLSFQRWMEFPDDPEVVVDTWQNPADVSGRLTIWVNREVLLQPIASDEVVNALEDGLGGGMSAWPFVPENRLVAASLLGLVPRWADGEYEEGA